MDDAKLFDYFKIHLGLARLYLEDNLAGKKLTLNPADGFDQAYIDMLNAMYDQHDLDAPAAHYYVTEWQEQNGEAALIRKVNTAIHPLMEAQDLEARAILKNAQLKKIENLGVFGADLHFRNRDGVFVEADGTSQHVLERTDNFILSSRADLRSVAQFCALVSDRIEKAATAPLEDQKNIAIDISAPRHAALMNVLGLYDEAELVRINQRLKLCGSGVSICAAENTLTAISFFDHHGADVEKAPRPLPPLLGTTRPIIYFATGNEEKLGDGKRIIHKGDLDVHLTSADDLGGPSRAADEFTGTFGGNAYDKLIQTLKIKLALPQTVLAGALNSGFILSGDGGGSFNDRTIGLEPEYDEVRSLIPPGGEFFGPETKPVAEILGGPNASYETAVNVLQRRNGGADRSVTDHCVFILAPLHQQNLADPVYYAYKASARLEIAETPSQSLQRTPKDYLRVPNTGRTIAELEQAGSDKAETSVAFGKAMAGMLVSSGARQSVPMLTPAFNAASGFTILTSQNYTAQPISPEGKIKPLYSEIFKNAGLALYDRRFELNDLSDVKGFLEGGQGYMFSPPLTDDPLLHTLMKSAIFVGKQLGDHRVAGGPWVNYTPKGMQQDPFIDIVQHMSRCGVMSNVMQCMDMHIDERDLGNVVSIFRNYAASYKPAHRQIPEYARQRLPDSGRDNVSILLSASFGMPEHLNDTYQIGHNFARNGIGVLSGMGRKYMMGVLVYSVLELKAQGLDVFTAGVQDPYAVKREEWPKEFMDRLFSPDHAFIANDIFERIEHLIELEKLQANPGMKKLMVAMTGGPGTLEEIVAPLWLKSKGDPALENLQMIVMNRQTLYPDGVKRGPYDKFLSYAGKQLDDLGVRVTENVADTIRLAGEFYGRPFEFHDVQYRASAPQYPFEAVKNPELVAKLQGRQPERHLMAG